MYTQCLSNSYRIHLSPGSRRNSARINAARKRASGSLSSTSSASTESGTPRHSWTPPLDHGCVYPPPPDSPPPLTQATLPSTSTHRHSRMDSASSRVSATPSPSYSSDSRHTLPTMSSSQLSFPVLNYNYRGGTTSYHDQTLSNQYGTFVNNPSPVSGTSQNDSLNAVGGSNFSYSHSSYTYDNHSQQHSRSTSPSAVMPSRLSISHINNSQYPSHGPPSSPSVSSSTSAQSGPPTPSYAYTYNTDQYTHPHAMVASQPTAHNTQIHSSSHLFQDNYTPNGVVTHPPRYSPPLTLAPIQDERYIRRLENPRHLQSYNSAHYLPQPQPVHDYSPYHHPMGLGHGAWKTEALRKGLVNVL